MKALKTDKKADSPTYNRAKSDQDSVRYQQKTEPDFVGSGYYPPERFVPLLAKLSHPANASQRAQLFNQLQRQYGNRYVQRIVSAYRSQNVEEEESTIVSEQTYVVQQNGEKVQRKFMVGKNDQNINQNKPQRAAMSRSRFRANEHPLPEMQQSTTGHAVLRRYESDKERRSSNSTLPGLTTEWRTGSPSVEKSIPVSSLDLQIRNQVEASLGSGHQLAPDLRFVAERQLKSNLSDVRIHIGKRADVLAQDLSALGFTLGANVFLSSQATHKPEIMTHELRHAAQRDRTRLHFWARPQQAATYATRLSTTLRIVSLPPRFSYHTLENSLAPLFQRANPQHPQFGRRSQELVRWFFQGYGGDGAENEQAGVQAFLNDLASCLERMADAGRLREATSYGPREQRRAARLLYLRNLERIELSGYTGLQDLARARADQINATERLAEHRREERAGEEERGGAEQRWSEFWTQYFRRENPAFAPFARWMLRHWDTVCADSDIQTLRWAPSTNSREYRRSFDVVLCQMPANPAARREYIEERDDYFSSVYDSFRSAVERTRGLMSSFVESYTSWVSVAGAGIDRPEPPEELRSQVRAWIHIRSWSLRIGPALPEPVNQWIRYWDSIIMHRTPRGEGIHEILNAAGLRGVT